LFATDPTEVRVKARRTCVSLVVTVSLCAGCGGSADRLGPTGKIGTMALARGTASDADLKFFDVCDPVIVKPGAYERSCDVPRVSRLFIGYGDFAPTRKAIDLDSKQSNWEAWIDGRSVDLPAFGTSDRTLLAFPAAGGKDVILREWRLMLLDVTPGQHTLRYRNRHAVHGTTDLTWTFTAAEG
jgi:hypothetical protein